MTSYWQDVYDKIRCARCGAAAGQPCRRGSGHYEATAPHAARRRAAVGLASFSGDAARAAGWVPLAEVVDALRNHDAFVEWTRTNGPAGYLTTYLSREGRRIAANYLADRFGTKEQP